MFYKFSEKQRSEFIDYVREKYGKIINHAQADECIDSLVDFVEIMTRPR